MHPKSNEFPAYLRRGVVFALAPLVLAACGGGSVTLDGSAASSGAAVAVDGAAGGEPDARASSRRARTTTTDIAGKEITTTTDPTAGTTTTGGTTSPATGTTTTDSTTTTTTGTTSASSYVVPDPTNVVRVRGSNGAGLTNHPLQFGRPFVAGEIPACPRVLVNGSPATAQVDVKSRHPDGSVRFAVISTVLASVPAGGAATLTFAQSSACDANTPITSTDMLSTKFNFDAQVTLNAGKAGTASARQMVTGKAYTTWTAGPVATTAIIADHKTKAFDFGPDANRSLRPVFEAQFWPSINRTRVRVILEAVDTEKVQNQTYDVAVKMGATSPQTVLSAAGVKHNYMSRWTRVFWIGGAPQAADVDYGVGYLAKTRALPNYDASITLSGTTKNALVSAWASAPKTLFAKGLWGTDMRVAGGRPDLGPYPKWMTAWLYEGSAALRDVALGQADLAASWPVHLREGNSAKRLDRDQTAPALGLPVSGYARPTLTYQALSYTYTASADRVKTFGTLSGNGWIPDVAHEPQPFFIPYLLTGEHFYKEQLQFWAGYSLLDQAWGLYGNYCYSKNVSPKYLGIGGQVRGWAWGFRMLAETAWATPDADPSKAWLASATEDVIVRQEGLRGIVRGTNSARPDWKWANTTGDCSRGEFATGNPLRFWSLGNSGYGSNTSVQTYEAVWQYSFVQYALNRAYELGLPAEGLRAWHAGFFHGAAANGGLTGYHTADYKIPVRDAQTGKLYQTWNAVNAEYTSYDANKLWPPNTTPGSNSTNAHDQGYATAALAAFASTYGVGDAANVWSGFAAKHYAAWGWSANPKWAILPRNGVSGGSPTTWPTSPTTDPTTSPTTSPTDPTTDPSTSPTSGTTTDPTTGTTDPSSGTTTDPTTSPTTGTSDPVTTDPVAAPALPLWLSTAKVYEWRTVPNSRLGTATAWSSYTKAAGTMGKPGVFAYSGGALKPRGSELFIAGGGHTDYAGNEIFSIELGSATPTWKRRIDPSAVTPMNTSYYPDGRPTSRHTYRNLHYSVQRDRLMFFGGAPYGDAPTERGLIDAFNPATNAYEPAGTFAGGPTKIGGPSGTGMSAQGDFVVHSHKDGNLYRWNQGSNTWTNLGNKGGMQYETPYAVDTKRNRLFRIPWGGYGARTYDLNNGGAFANVKITGPAAASIDTGASMVYDPVSDAFWLLKRGDNKLYRIDAATFSATVQTVSGALPVLNINDFRHRLYGRFAYAPELRALVLMSDQDSEVRVIRTAP